MTSPKSLSRTALSTVSADTIVTSLLTVQTSGRGFVDLTAEVAKFVRDARRDEGAVTLFIRHTSASLTIQENADPSVLDDLMTALDRLAPEDAGWSHDTEGPDDMPAHIKTMLTATSLHIPVLEGRTRARNLAGDLSDRASRAVRTGARSCCSSSAPFNGRIQGWPHSDPRPACRRSSYPAASPPAPVPAGTRTCSDKAAQRPRSLVGVAAGSTTTLPSSQFPKI